LSTHATAGRRAEIPEPNITRCLFADTRMAPVSLVVRVYPGARLRRLVRVEAGRMLSRTVGWKRR
jgi:hypothetical protein